jgi:CheY-like chemotaxis protein
VKKILVVDDEPFILDYVGKVLTEAGYSISNALTGDAAWEMVSKQRIHFDLVLTDVVMPGSIDGLTLANRIRRHETSQRVVFMTGALPEGDPRGNGLQLNRDLLRKPFFPHQLRRFVDLQFAPVSSA